MYALQVVYLYIPTSNHNYRLPPCSKWLVVYLYIPTSNHNCERFGDSVQQLYIFIFLHQTTTPSSIYEIRCGCISLYSYIKPQLSLVPNLNERSCISLYSYIKPQLPGSRSVRSWCCISLYSYIKPQHKPSQQIVWVRCISLYSYIKPQPDRLH